MSVFIVRPFGCKDGVDFDRTESELIQPAMAAADVRGGTTGLIARSGNIRLDMFERLVLADLVIADISIHNANVFYELGIRHALRDRPTILLRARKDEVPFDLKTDRYLEYAADAPAAAVDALTRAIGDSLRARNVDSPVYLLLPELKPPSTDKLRGVPEQFREAVTIAVAHGDTGRLGLLAEEIDGLDWALAGRRLIGKALFEKRAYRSARTWLEFVVREDRDDTEANLLLATVYQRLGDLSESTAAIGRVLEHEGLPSWTRAEKCALAASNRKTQWIAEWLPLAPEARAARALDVIAKYAPIETYEDGFVEDQNHFYSGLNALALRTLILELAKTVPDAWNGQFDTDSEATAKLEDAKVQRESLRAAVFRSLEAARMREEARVRRAHGDPDVWLALSIADYYFLIGTRPTAVAARYREALGRVRDWSGFSVESAARQIRMFRDLGVFVDKATAALEAIGAAPIPPAPAARARVIVFSGHRLDRSDRPAPRFPAAKVAAATEAIRRCVLAEKALSSGAIKGFAGAANGSDIIFHEVCAAEAISTTALLALPVDDYAAASVNDAGPEWSERYHKLVQRCAPRILANSADLPPWAAERPNYGVWNRNNLWVLHTALAEDDADITLIVLWDGKGGDGPGGTADMAKIAEKRGMKVVCIDPAQL